MDSLKAPASSPWIASNWLSLRAIVRTAGMALGLLTAAVVPTQAAPGDVFIIIANQTYANGVPAVAFADRDASEMEKAARAPQVLNVPAVGVKRLNDVTRGGAEDWFRRDGTPGRELMDHLARATGGRKDGTIYFYYTGHGISARNAERATDELHLVLSDTRTNDVGATALSVAAVQLALSKAQREFMPQGRVVLFVDACFSGTDRNNEPLWAEARMIGAGAQVKASLPDRVVMLTAARANEPAWSDPVRQHGAFTDALLDGIYGRAAQPDGAITAQRLHEFVATRVNARLVQSNRSQTPTMLGDGGARVAKLSAPFPTRPGVGVEELKLRCNIMRQSRDMQAVREFLERTCQDECPCRDELEQSMKTCTFETTILDEIVKRGPAAKPELVTLRDSARCPAVKTKATEAVSVWERETAQRRCRDALDSPTPEGLRRYLDQTPDGSCAADVRARLATMTRPVAPPPPPLPATTPTPEIRPAPPSTAQPTVPTPVFIIRRMNFHWADGGDGDAKIYGGTREDCERLCLARNDCQFMEYYFGTEDKGNKCLIFNHSRSQSIIKSKSKDTHIGIKVRRP